MASSGNPPSGFELEQLPTELVQLVFQHAGPVDRAVLASASKGMRFVGGAQTIDDIFKNRETAWAFLQRVERDADPRRVPCLECLSLHAPQACLPSCDDPAVAGYNCRRATVRALEGLGGRLLPALYALAKYERLGLDTSWFPDADRELRHPQAISLVPGVLEAEAWDKLNASARGVFSRRRYVLSLVRDRDGARAAASVSWFTCDCGHSLPLLTLAKVAAGEEPTGSMTVMRTRGGPGGPEDPMLPGFPFARGSQTPVVGPMMGCEHCNTDLQAEVRYRADGEPQLIITRWVHHGPAETADDVRLAVEDQLRGKSNKPRLSWGIGQIAEASSML